MKKLIITILSVITLSSCGTLFSGSSQEMSFDSNEPDVKIYVNGEYLCETPCVTDVDRKRKRARIQAKKDGFPTKNMQTDRKMNPVTLLNAISTVWGTFGLSTDFSSDGMWEYQRDSFYFNMRQEPKTKQEKELYEKEDKVRAFVLKNHPQIQTELFNGDGGSKEYVISLQKLTNLEIAEIREIVESANNEVECAERLASAHTQNLKKK